MTEHITTPHSWVLITQYFETVLFVCRCRLARVTTLVKRKEELNSSMNSEQTLDAEDTSDTDVDARELEEFLDWRSKKAWT